MTTPSETSSLATLQAIQSLDGDALDDLIEDEVGDYMLGVIKALAKATSPGDDDDQLYTKVHLMVLAYLMRAHADGGLEI